MTTLETIEYHYRGQIEVGRNYVWQDGYSANGPSGGVLYPWATKRACRDEARSQGKRAVFFRGGKKELRR